MESKQAKGIARDRVAEAETRKPWDVEIENEWRTSRIGSVSKYSMMVQAMLLLYFDLRTVFIGVFAISTLVGVGRCG